MNEEKKTEKVEVGRWCCNKCGPLKEATAVVTIEKEADVIVDGDSSLVFLNEDDELLLDVKDKDERTSSHSVYTVQCPKCEIEAEWVSIMVSRDVANHAVALDYATGADNSPEAQAEFEKALGDISPGEEALIQEAFKKLRGEQGNVNGGGAA